MPSIVDWGMAERVATRVARSDPFAASYHYASLAPDFAELTAQAEALVAAETGLRAAGPARARVVERPAWIRANVGSFQRLLRPVLTKLEDRAPRGAPVAATLAGAEVGLLLGWMSGRVLGQYDLLVVEDEAADDQDVVYYVGPNVLALEKRFGFPPRQFRLWIALHEVTHRAQFTGVPWLRGHFLGLVHELMDLVDPDPARFLGAVRDAATAARQGRRALDDGLLGLVAGPQQRAVLGRLSGLMSLLEGHGDVTMNRAGAGLVPSAERFERVLKQRRESASGMAKLVQRLVGLDAKLAQYAQGERFLAAIEAERGPRAVDRCWEGPELLPTIEEIREPARWLARVPASPVPA